MQMWWPWALLGALALVGETMSTALFLLNIAIAAFVVAILSLLGFPLPLQIGVFVALSFLLIGLARPRMMQALIGRGSPAPALKQEALVGRIATVREPIGPDGGTIQIGHSEFWTARSAHPLAEIGRGQHVRITAVHGVTAFVEPWPAIAAGASAGAAPDPAAANSPPEPAFGALLKQYRTAAGLTQEELAERARLSVRAISDLERGLHRAPQKDTVALLVAALGLSEDEARTFEAAARRSRNRDAPAAPTGKS